MITRRQLLTTTSNVVMLTAAGAVLPASFRLIPGAFAAIPGGSLDPTEIDKFAMPLVIPPAMPKTGQVSGVDYYEIAVRQFQQQILPAGMPATTVWSYGSVHHPNTFNYPAFTLEAKFHIPVRVKWINGLVDGNGGFLPHLLSVDPTLHWANPPGGIAGRDTRPTFSSTPGPYTGPVPLVTHLHGGHSAQESDGYAEAWFLLPRIFRRVLQPWALSTTSSGASSYESSESSGSAARPRLSIRTINARAHSGITTIRLA